MSITVKEVLYRSGRKYGLKLLAGAAGMRHPISWMYTAEDYKTVDYIRGGELIVTTGMILATETIELENWLRILIDKLVRLRASGLIINVGKYIPEVPKTIISYCDELNMPLIVMPWEVHLVDIYRDICGALFDSEQREKNIVRALTIAIFDQRKLFQYEEILQRNGYGAGVNMAVVCLSCSATTKEKYLLNSIIHVSFSEIQNYAVIHEPEEVVVVLADEHRSRINEAASVLAEKLNRYYSYDPIYAGMSAQVNGIQTLSRAYQEARFALKTAIKENKKECSFERLGFQKLLYAIHDQYILNQYFEETLGSLYQYDLEHQTKYMDILQLYLNGVPKEMIAQKSFQHRNTISNQLKKIWSIIGKEPESPEERFRYQVAFYIFPYIKRKEN